MTPTQQMDLAMRRLREELAVSLTLVDRTLEIPGCRALYPHLLGALGTLQTRVRSAKWILRRYTPGEGAP
jgi:hypothetical protein